jgi:hypothetical protein
MQIAYNGGTPDRETDMPVRPRYRDITSFGRIYLWLDIRDGASAAVGTAAGELNREDLARLFRIARSNEIEVSAKRPLIVYGAVTPLGETEIFRFVQVSPQEITALVADIKDRK